MNLRRIFSLSAFCALTLSLLLSQPIFAQPEDLQANADALALIDAVNALRKEKNLPPYQVNDILMRVAQSHADHVASAGFLSRYEQGLAPHQRAIKAGYPVAGDLTQGGLYAENLASGLNATVDAAIQKWRSDPQYFHALYAEDLEDVGAGVASANGVSYFVLDVGSALDDPAYWYTATPTSDGIVSTSTPLEDGKIYHTVQANEYLWNIALAYALTVEDLMKLNRLPNTDVYEGQKLLIYQPTPGPTLSPTPGITPTATFGIPSSTPTQPVTPTATLTFTPQPTPPASVQSGGKVIGAIVLVALFAAGVGAWLGRKKEKCSGRVSFQLKPFRRLV
jgi:uncharacterized protein YkwD